MSEPPPGIVTRLRQVFSRDRRGSESRSPALTKDRWGGPRGPEAREGIAAANGRGSEEPVAVAPVVSTGGDGPAEEGTLVELVSPSPQTSSIPSAPDGVYQSGKSDAALPKNSVDAAAPPPIQEQQQDSPPQIPAAEPIAGPPSSTLPILDSIPARGSNEISLVSLNMLADHNLSLSLQNPQDARYRHAIEAAPWSTRKTSLIRLLTALSPSADVIALQEADYFPFQNDILPEMREIGFDGVHQWDGTLKENQPPHPWGTAILFRSALFSVGFKETRSRGLVLGLCREGSSLSDYFIVNVHLEGNSEHVEKQLKQLHSTIYKMSTHANVDPATARVIVCGDFNSTASDAPMTWLINGSLPGPKPMVTAHAFKFLSALDLAGFNPVTYADPFCAERVDHVAFTCDTLEPLCVYRTPAHEIIKGPLFSKSYPSDHLPVGAAFRDKAVAPPRAVVSNDPDACPLTEGQLRVFLFLMEGAPVRNKRGKPSAKKLAAIRAHQDQLDNFASHLSPAAKEWVEGWKRREKKKKAGSDNGEAKVEDPPPLIAKRLSSETIANRPSRSASVKLMQALSVDVAMDPVPKPQLLRRKTVTERMVSAPM